MFSLMTPFRLCSPLDYTSFLFFKDELKVSGGLYLTFFKIWILFISSYKKYPLEVTSLLR